MQKKRIYWLDISKGIAIICVIMGHNVSFGGNVRNLIYSFHMPLFFILTGYTIKQVPCSCLAKATFKDFKRLIIPVLIVTFLKAIAEVIIHYVPVKNVILDIFLKILWGNGCGYRNIGFLWFLLVLFYSKLLFRLVLNSITKYREIFCLSLAFLFSEIGKKIWLPQSFDLLFPAMLFMDTGYVFRNKIKEDSKSVKIVGLFAFVFWIYMAWCKGIYIELAPRQYPLSVVSMLIAICGSFCIIQFSKSIENLKVSKFLAFVGKNSLDLLCIHQLDGYYSFLWKTIYFSENTKFCLITPYNMQLLFHVFIDLAIFLLWILLKEKLLKKKRS